MQQRSKLGRIGFILVLVSIVMALVSGPGYQMGLWGLAMALMVLLGGSLIGVLLGGICCMAGAYIARPGTPYRGFRSSLIGLVLAVGMLSVLGPQLQMAARVPPIHDISTDTVSPPQFVALLSERQSAPNGADYAGAELAQLQQKAYPDIQPIILAQEPEEAFARALASVKTLGWELAGYDADSGRIEATQRSRWFGFADDVVIRIRPDGTGSRVDVRSMSRVGKSDLGVNAARIRRFSETLSTR